MYEKSRNHNRGDCHEHFHDASGSIGGILKRRGPLKEMGKYYFTI